MKKIMISLRRMLLHEHHEKYGGSVRNAIMNGEQQLETECVDRGVLRVVEQKLTKELMILNHVILNYFWSGIMRKIM